MVWVLVAVETVTLNCPTFCELLPCSAGLVLGLDSALSGQAWACVQAGGKTEGPCLRQRPTGGPRGSFRLPLPFHVWRDLVSHGGCQGTSCPMHKSAREPRRSPLLLWKSSPSALWSTMVLINQPFTTPSLALKDGVPAVAWGGRANRWYSWVPETVRWSEASKQNPSSSLSLDLVPSCLPSLYPLESNPCSEGEPRMKH